MSDTCVRTFLLTWVEINFWHVLQCLWHFGANDVVVLVDDVLRGRGEPWSSRYCRDQLYVQWKRRWVSVIQSKWRQHCAAVCWMQSDAFSGCVCLILFYQCLLAVHTASHRKHCHLLLILMVMKLSVIKCVVHSSFVHPVHLHRNFVV